MYTVVLLASRGNGNSPLLEAVSRAGLSCQVWGDLSPLAADGASPEVEAVLLDLESLTQASQFIEQCKEINLPVLALVPVENGEEYDPSLNADEFIFCPFQDGELVARVRQAIYRVKGPSGSKIVKAGDLTIDLERYDVTVAGRRVNLTYKEFQLLALLASNPGRVYTREALLSNVWDYDYVGGTRTVDVHVRRLRSKVEGPGHTYIETIWNVGYRFKTPS